MLRRAQEIIVLTRRSWGSAQEPCRNELPLPTRSGTSLRPSKATPERAWQVPLVQQRLPA